MEKEQKQQVDLFYSERLELVMRTYRNELVRVLQQLQSVYNVSEIFGKKISDYEGYIATCTMILNQIKQVSNFLGAYGKIDEPISEFVLSEKQLYSTPSLSGDERVNDLDKLFN